MSSATLPHQPDNAPSRPETGSDQVIPILEETALISRELVETGRVRLTKTVTEHTETVPLDLLREEVRVERVPVNQFLPDDQPPPTSRYEGDTLIVPVLREVLVKRLLLVEEYHVHKQQVATTESQTVVLRRENLEVERLPPRTSPASDAP